MKYLLLATVLAFSGASFAANEERPAPKGPHNVSGTLGFNGGGPTIGGEYEYMYDDSSGVGGFFREFPKDTNTNHFWNGIFIVGGQANHHFYKKNWDFDIAPGVAIINIQQARPSPPAPGDTTTFGPTLNLSLLCQLNNMVAVGFEYANYWVWFDSNYAGHLRSDMSAKVRVTF